MTPDNDYEGGDHDQWARHEITHKYKKEAAARASQAMLNLLNACSSTSDIKVARAFGVLQNAEAMVHLFRTGAERREATRA